MVFNVEVTWRSDRLSLISAIINGGRWLVEGAVTTVSIVSMKYFNQVALFYFVHRTHSPPRPRQRSVALPPPPTWKNRGRFSDSPRCTVPSTTTLLLKDEETLYGTTTRTAEENGGGFTKGWDKSLLSWAYGSYIKQLKRWLALKNNKLSNYIERYR